jgi:integrase
MSRRTVVLPKLAARHLREYRKRQNARHLPLGEAWCEHGLVFASTIGTPIEPRNINRRWDELRQRAGLDWLRLSRAIMEVLGHSGTSVTMNTYAHVLPEFRQEAPTRSMSCSGRHESPFGSSFGSNDGRCKIAMGL